MFYSHFFWSIAKTVLLFKVRELLVTQKTSKGYIKLAKRYKAIKK